MKEIWLLWHFLYDFEGNFVCPAFLQFWCNFIHCKLNLLINADSTVICVPCMLQHACYELFFLTVDLEDILLPG